MIIMLMQASDDRTKRRAKKEAAVVAEPAVIQSNNSNSFSDVSLRFSQIFALGFASTNARVSIEFFSNKMQEHSYSII